MLDKFEPKLALRTALTVAGLTLVTLASKDTVPTNPVNPEKIQIPNASLVIGAPRLTVSDRLKEMGVHTHVKKPVSERVLAAQQILWVPDEPTPTPTDPVEPVIFEPPPPAENVDYNPPIESPSISENQLLVPVPNIMTEEVWDEAGFPVIAPTDMWPALRLLHSYYDFEGKHRSEDDMLRLLTVLPTKLVWDNLPETKIPAVNPKGRPVLDDQGKQVFIDSVISAQTTLPKEPRTTNLIKLSNYLKSISVELQAAKLRHELEHVYQIIRYSLNKSVDGQFCYDLEADGLYQEAVIWHYFFGRQGKLNPSSYKGIETEENQRMWRFLANGTTKDGNQQIADLYLKTSGYVALCGGWDVPDN